MKTSNLYSILFVFFMLIGIHSCAEKEDLNPALTYTLVVENNLTRSVDVYIKPQTETGEPFILAGTAISNEEFEILELIVKQPYRLRFVNQGRPEGEFFEEKAIANLDAEMEVLRLMLSEEI